jgi:hypothetical protein
MTVIVEQSVEWELVGETEELGGNLPQCHFVHQKSHMAWPGLEPGPQRFEALRFLLLLEDLQITGCYLKICRCENVISHKFTITYDYMT